MPEFIAGGRRIYHEDTGGAGPALLFSHSFGMTGAMFAPQLAVFAPAWRCITWDERAHGRSPADGPFDFWDSARDLLGLLDHLGVGQAVLVGTSQGGFLSLRAALTAPERIRGLAILGSSAAAEDAAQKATFRQMLAAFVGDGAAQARDEVIEAMAHISFGPRFTADAQAEAWKAHWRRWPPDQMTLALEALVERDDILGRLSKVTAPTLVMHGSDDGSYAPSFGEAIAAGVANSRGFVLVEGGAHFLSLTDPEPVNRALGAFLAGLG